MSIPTRTSRAPLWRALPSLIALAVAAVVIAGAGGIEGPSGIYPLVLAVLLAAAGVYCLVRDLLTRPAATGTAPAGTARDPAGAHDPADAAPGEERPEDSGPRAGSVRVLAVIAAVILFLALVSAAGFWLALTVPLLTALVVMGARSPWRIALAAGLMIGVAYGLFGELLDISFPTGAW